MAPLYLNVRVFNELNKSQSEFQNKMLCIPRASVWKYSSKLNTVQPFSQAPSQFATKVREDLRNEAKNCGWAVATCAFLRYHFSLAKNCTPQEDCLKRCWSLIIFTFAFTCTSPLIPGWVSVCVCVTVCMCCYINITVKTLELLLVESTTFFGCISATNI